MYTLNVNGTNYNVNVTAETPLLWTLRDVLGLTGTKYGCGVGQCGACTVHVNGKAQRSCQIQVKDVKASDKITTIEGLSPNRSHPIQQAWLAHEVPQCGYCQSGQIMAAAALLAKTPQPTDKQIDDAMTVVCRCGTYQRIREAIHTAAKGGGRTNSSRT